MSSEHTDMLTRVFCDVLEKMAFMFGDPAEPEEMPESVPEPLVASISFEGPVKGALHLAVSRSMSIEIAANSLGMDPEDPEVASKGEDALKELLNVVCGNVLTELAGEEPVFDLSIPELKAVDQKAWNTLQGHANTALFIVDDFPALMNLSLK